MVNITDGLRLQLRVSAMCAVSRCNNRVGDVIVRRLDSALMMSTCNAHNATAAKPSAANDRRENGHNLYNNERMTSR